MFFKSFRVTNSLSKVGQKVIYNAQVNGAKPDLAGFATFLYLVHYSPYLEKTPCKCN